MIPRLGDPPRSETSYRLRPGAYAVLIAHRRILLTRQHLETGLEYQLPGGGIDPGEAALPALHREVFEETGYRCAILRRLGSYRRFTWMVDYGFHAEKLCTIYVGRPTLRLGAPTEPHHSAIWVPLSEAAARLTNPADRPFVRRAIEQVLGAG